MGTLGIIIGALAAVFAGIATYASQKKTNQFNQSQYEDWKDYNTPANQMSRLTDAGLNPYMVNGVSNTLSQPFQVGSTENLSSLFQGLSSAAGQAANYQLKSDANAIRKDSVDIQRGKLELEKQFTELKKDMMRNALKKGDAQAAMFWSSVSQKDVVTNYLKRTMPFRVGSAFYDYLRKQQDYSFYELFNPMRLDWYEPMQRAKVNNLNANTSHLGWYENFALQRFLFDQEMSRRNFILNRDNRNGILSETILNNAFRRNLSREYLDLATSKWITDNAWKMVNFGSNRPLLQKRRHSPGSYDIFEDYIY